MAESKPSSQQQQNIQHNIHSRFIKVCIRMNAHSV
uniref:Uncharacterized protein n=1 Tax=Anguilla anguilla TaxID=7936 RepID=A0A0E9Q9B1_ANGAN